MTKKKEMNDQCSRCKPALYPQDPSVFFGGLRPLCYSCPDFDYQKEVLEKPLERDVPKMGIPRPSARVDSITQLRGQVLYLHNKLNEHLDKSKKRRDRL